MVDPLDLPSNSHTAKEPKKVADGPTTDRVVVNEAVRRKKPVGRRFMDNFVRGDARSAGEYMLWEILVPAAKDAVSDAVGGGIERILFGESRGTSRRGRTRSRGNGFVNYGGMSRDPREEPRRLSNRGRAQHDFDEIILPTRDEAEVVIEQMGVHLDKYEFVTVADMLAFCGLSSTHTDQKWGWDTLSDASVARTRDGYLLDLPRPKPID